MEDGKEWFDGQQFCPLHLKTYVYAAYLFTLLSCTN